MSAVSLVVSAETCTRAPWLAASTESEGAETTAPVP